MKPGGSLVRRVGNAVLSTLDPRVYLHALRLLHYFNYSHVAERRKVRLGRDVRLAPNVSFANAERVSIGDRAEIGARCHLWAGRVSGRIVIGEEAALAPEVFVTVSKYRLVPGRSILNAPTIEADVIIGHRVWLATRVIVLAGVSIGDGCVVGAGSVVTKSLPAWTIALGVPAQVVGWREGADGASADPAGQPDGPVDCGPVQR
jgi:acetyltransferase-like isoleucine patch superfamily enzyme